MGDNTKLDNVDVIETLRAQIEKAEPSRRQRILEAIALAVLGSFPWLGGFLSAVATFGFEESSANADSLRSQWLVEHQKKLEKLRDTLSMMHERLAELGEAINQRIESKEYLMLVRKTFRQWDQSDTEQERNLLVQLITNAAGTRICSDDVLRLFLDWINSYHEAHFAVIQQIFRNERPTRYDIWLAIYGEPVPRDDSAEADLYKMLIRDLSTGGVIRQPQDSDSHGRFRKKVAAPRRTSLSGTLESPFEDTKQYILTDLGKQFVHYTMTELVSRLGDGG